MNLKGTDWRRRDGVRGKFKEEGRGGQVGVIKITWERRVGESWLKRTF